MSLWRIAFGDYDFALDRRALTVSLIDTKSETVWAENLPLGWVELEEIATGTRTRFDFEHARVVSISEKAGPQGKRILLGLDLRGVPLDVYVICGQREIQLTAEAARDTSAYRVQDMGLLPGLVSVPDDGASYLVIPHGEGAMLFARDAPETPLPLPIWDASQGVTMPFIGAVRCDNGDVRRARTALALLTDSAYGRFTLSRTSDGSARLDTEYARDPERRRLDIRLVVLPGENHVAVARAYRDKLIGDRNHVTLRKKLRDVPSAEQLVGSALVTFSGDPKMLVEALPALRQQAGLERAFHIVTNTQRDLYAYTEPDTFREQIRHWYASGKQINDLLHGQQIPVIAYLDYVGINDQTAFAFIDDPRMPPLLDNDGEPVLAASRDEARVWTPRLAEIAREELPGLAREGGFDGFALDIATEPLFDSYSKRFPQNRWEDMEHRLEVLAAAPPEARITGVASSADWSAVASLFRWRQGSPCRHSISLTSPLPLFATIYHDSVIDYGFYDAPQERDALFLRWLLALMPPSYMLTSKDAGSDEAHVAYIRCTNAVLAPLHQLTFAAFLTEHRFLTADRTVEEAVYSDKTRIVINQSETDTWEDETLHLPPLGFYARHSQMEAHDASRVGNQTFETRAWRVARSQDGLPLETSQNVMRQEFPV